MVVSFSGGKDSTVLLHLVRSVFPNVKAVFSNTGLEYPEIQRHVRSIDNVDIVTPSMRFDEVISTYGYPLIGKEVAEAIYYARRIRSQSGNVERERERERAGQQRGSSTNCQVQGNGASADQRSGKAVTQRLQNWGGAERPSECDRESSIPQTDKFSHRDKHCAEQTNSPDGQDGRCKRTGGSAGVAETKLNGGYSEADRRMKDLSGKRSGNDWKSGGADQTAPEGNIVQDRPESERLRGKVANSQTSRDSTDWHNWRRGCL